MDSFAKAQEGLYDAIQKNKGSKSSLGKSQGDDEKKLCDFVRGKVEDSRQSASRVSSEGVWLTNIAYLLGYDNIYYDTTFGMYRPSNLGWPVASRSRISVNEILPRAQNRASRLTKNPPRYDVRPKSSGDEDKDAARLGFYLIKQVWDQQQVNKKRLELVMHEQQAGHAYLKTCWDKTLGPKVPVQSINGEVSYLPIGDIRIDVVSAFEVFPDDLAKSFDELTYLTHARIRPLHYFRDQYGEAGEQVMAEDVWLTSLQYEYRANNSNAISGEDGLLVKNSAIELSYYEKPSYKNPFGRHIVTAGGVLLKNGPLPIDEIPFAKFDDVLIGGKYYSESVITHARPIQDQLNRVISMRADWTNKMLAGKYLAARGHGIMKEGLHDESGEVVEYDPVPNAPSPSYMQVPMIPQYAYNEDDYLLRKLDNIFGINEVSRGQLPSASIPAIGMQFLVEQDDTRIGVVTEQNEYAYASVGRQILKYAEKYMDYPRLLKAAGKGLEYAVKEFVGADLNGNNDVIVVRGSTLPGSKVLDRQDLLSLYREGILGDPKDPKVIENLLSQLEYGDVQEVWKDHSLDMGQIKKGIQSIENGQKPAVSEFDNHPMWIQELNRYRKSDKWDQMPDENKMILLEVMNDHLNEIVNLQVPDESANPQMQESTAAQEMEQEIQAQEGVPNPDDIQPPIEEGPV